MQRTTTPKDAHATAGSFEREYQGSWGAESLMKHIAGKMKASAVAEAPPVISSMTPRSQVTRATVYGRLGVRWNDVMNVSVSTY